MFSTKLCMLELFVGGFLAFSCFPFCLVSPALQCNLCAVPKLGLPVRKRAQRFCVAGRGADAGPGPPDVVAGLSLLWVVDDV